MTSPQQFKATYSAVQGLGSKIVLTRFLYRGAEDAPPFAFAGWLAVEKQKRLLLWRLLVVIV
jgi:hypothetical protein